MIVLCGVVSLSSCNTTSTPINDISVRNGEDGRGIVSIEKTSSDGNADTYTITYSDGTTSTFTVTNGEDGERGIQGEAGEDGHTPAIAIGENGNWFIDGVDTGISAKGNNGNDANHYGETFTVTYHLEGGEMPDGYQTNIIVNWGDVLDLPIPTRHRYQFNGWFTGNTINDKQFYSTDAVFKDLDLYATWIEGTYKITLNLNGGVYDGPTTIPVTTYKEYSLPNEDVIYENYVLVGWREDEMWDFAGYYLLERDVTLTAVWTPIHSIEFSIDYNGGSAETSASIATTTEEIHKGLVKLDVPTKSGFDFIGYYFEGKQVTDQYGNFIQTRLFNFDFRVNLIARYVASDGSLTGDYIYFGEYPQTQVKDVSIIDSLLTAIDSDGNGYLNYENKEYLKVDYTYFEVEPILWKISENGELISSKILDAVTYCNSSRDRTYENQTIYANNYQYSNVRAFLNSYDGSSYNISDYSQSGFYSIAFSNEEKSQIETTIVDNCAFTTDSSSNQFVSENTNDKIYLLSYQEASIYFASDNERCIEYTDYSRSRELSIYNPENKISIWWLRSPGSGYKHNVSCVDGLGNVVADGQAYNSIYGIVPVLKLQNS